MASSSPPSARPSRWLALGALLGVVGGGLLWLRRRGRVQAAKYRVIFVLGGPGAGKGTQCPRIVERFGYVHLSAGDLLRAEQAEETSRAKMIREFIKEGKIVPVDVTIQLLRDAMNRHFVGSKARKFLVDGFPRNFENLNGWNKAMNTLAEVPFCLLLDVPNEALTSRLKRRGQSSKRSDDNMDSIRKRLKTFTAETKQVLDQFEQEGRLVRVRGTGTPDEVFELVAAEMQKLEPWPPASP